MVFRHLEPLGCSFLSSREQLGWGSLQGLKKGTLSFLKMASKQRWAGHSQGGAPHLDICTNQFWSMPLSMVNKGPRGMAGDCVPGVHGVTNLWSGLGSGEALAVTLDLGVWIFLSFLTCFALLEAPRLSATCLL